MSLGITSFCKKKTQNISVFSLCYGILSSFSSEEKVLEVGSLNGNQV
jgi:hypothetical protein